MNLQHTTTVEIEVLNLSRPKTNEMDLDPKPTCEPLPLTTIVQDHIEINIRAQDTPIDVDTFVARSPPPHRKTVCGGYVFKFTKGQNPHLTYPFALHARFTLPWDYSTRNGKLVLHAHSCDRKPTPAQTNCQPCRNLFQNSVLAGILSRAENGMHENSGYVFYGCGGMLEIIERKNWQLEALRLNGLNNTRQLTGQADSLSDHNRFLNAIASGEFENVQRLIRVNLKAYRGIKGLVGQYISAGLGKYKPKSYTEEDDMRGLLLWKLGGNRVAEIAHRSLGLPAITTLRNRSIMPLIVPSHAIPKTVEVAKNVRACYYTSTSISSVGNVDSGFIPIGQVIESILLFNCLGVL